MKVMACTPGTLAVELREAPDPEPASGEVRIRVIASSVNSADLKVAQRHSTARFLHARTNPLVVGYDFAGVVDGLGSGVDDLAVGDAVFGHLPYAGSTRQGAFAELVTVATGQVARLPAGVESVTAAASATVGLTALQAFRDLPAGGRVLVIGASGGVGSLAVPIGKRLGAHVTGVCSTYGVEHVRGLGADVVVDRKVADPLAHDTPFDVVFDTTGLYPAGQLSRLLTPSGSVVTTLPSLSFVMAKIANAFSRRSVRMVVVESRRDDLERLGAWIADGMPVSVAEQHAVRDLAAGLARLEAGGLLGKVAIEVSEGF